MNSLPELITTSLVALLLLMLPKWLPRPQECFTERYIQRGEYQYIKVCYDGVELEIEDTGLAKLDSVWYHDHIQPKIDSLKMTAQEIIEKNRPSVVSGTQVKIYSDVTIIEMMKEYARQKCKEQRKECARSWASADNSHEAESHAIVNAPEPKFD